MNELERPIAKGAQVYYSARSLAESEVLDMAAAEERHAALEALRRQGRPGAWPALRQGEGPRHGGVCRRRLSILVSTTVIEVGADVPNASIMVIEHAERFGLAQLHQLRGRVGRRGAVIVHFYRKPLSEAAQTRLNVMKSTEDGFVIAEEDLKLRGGGEVLGTRQSGLPEFAWRAAGRRSAAAGGPRRGAANAHPQSRSHRPARGRAEAAALSLRARRRGSADARRVDKRHL